MKTLVASVILAVSFLAGAANAAPVAQTQTQTDTVVENGCGANYGH